MSRRRSRQTRRTACIVTEGKAEADYFNAARAEVNRSSELVLTVRRGTGGSPGVVLRDALRAMREGAYDQVWCVLDADTWAANQDTHKKYLAEAKRAGLHVVFSNPSFEVWLRCHFEAKHSEWRSGAQAKIEIARLWDKQPNLRASQWWQELRSLLGVAISNAEQMRRHHDRSHRCILHMDCSTRVDELMIALGFSPSGQPPIPDL